MNNSIIEYLRNYQPPKGFSDRIAFADSGETTYPFWVFGWSQTDNAVIEAVAKRLWDTL